LNREINKLVVEAIKDQKEIFGDLLFENINSKIVYYQKEEGIAHQEVVKEKNESGFAGNSVNENFSNAKSLDELNSMICECQKCPLGKTRNKFVFGGGNPKAHAMLIGEAPGADEDKKGEPFVGRAGKLLNDILKAVNLNREDVYIANILKCRPPGNRDPQPVEMDTCIPYLNKQIELINPKIILCLGRIAVNALLNLNLSLSELRKSIHEYKGVKVVATYHPAALLRNPQWKRGCWEDVKKFRKLYDELLKD